MGLPDSKARQWRFSSRRSNSNRLRRHPATAAFPSEFRYSTYGGTQTGTEPSEAELIHLPLLEMKTKAVIRKLYDYVRYDLKEIAFPSSLPNPPHIKIRPKLTFYDRFLILKKATRLYCASWVRDIGPDLRPMEYKKLKENEGGPDGSNNGEKEPSVLEDLAMAARGGAETLKPALQRLYMTRASAYRDALKSFIEGYQEGVQQVVEKKQESETGHEGDTPKKSI
ncbi:hypothetical protein LINPERPRIM_LOCUS16340 [Linum perenne]